MHLSEIMQLHTTFQSVPMSPCPTFNFPWCPWSGLQWFTVDCVQCTLYSVNTQKMNTIRFGWPTISLVDPQCTNPSHADEKDSTTLSCHLSSGLFLLTVQRQWKMNSSQTFSKDIGTIFQSYISFEHTIQITVFVFVWVFVFSNPGKVVFWMCAQSQNAVLCRLTQPLWLL